MRAKLIIQNIRKVNHLPRRKFNRDEADTIWKNYSAKLIDSITESENEGLQKGYSSYEIEKLWQQKRMKSAIKNDKSSESSQHP